MFAGKVEEIAIDVDAKIVTIAACVRATMTARSVDHCDRSAILALIVGSIDDDRS